MTRTSADQLTKGIGEPAPAPRTAELPLLDALEWDRLAAELDRCSPPLSARG